jgi:hypothetical protein
MFKRFFAAIEHRINPINPIIVYQMGKVGSKTIEASLHHYFEQKNLRVKVHHTHNLINLKEMEENLLANRNRPNPKATLSQIRKDARLRNIIDTYPKIRWTLVSLVRDPIAQNVGAFFHNLKEFVPDWKEQSEQGTLDIESLHDLFLNKYYHKNAQTWFERQMQPMWNIDIYATPFDREAGYSIYKSEKADLLLIRLENLNECGTQAFKKFLNFENFELVNQNVGEEKDYKELYSAFKAHPLPVEFIEDMYNTPFTRHFYSEDEVEGFKRKWFKK